ncbi:MAG: lytic murein transglycosylase B [Proteobacteria bacterium]|nr:lytic murein transglycosylase B [Pseudomonadota bacterium]
MRNGSLRPVAVLAATCLVFGLTGPRAARALDVERPEVRRFIDHMVQDNGFKHGALRRLLRTAQKQNSIIDAMNRPAEKAKLWYEYRQIFLTEKRIRDGIDFWVAHREELERAAADTGVAPEYIVAILGVETQYGRQTGRYRVLDALATLAFDYPERAPFFTSELEQFLLMAREDRVDPRTATGSYAGAMGAPQFMPSSYRRFGMDGDGDGRIDLWSNWPDVFHSIGNYFREHGWQSCAPLMYEAELALLRVPASDGRRFSLDETIGSLREQGAQLRDACDATPDSTEAGMIAVDRPDGLGWRVGLKNFYVITRYNRSSLYAMAAGELAAALRYHVDHERLPVPDEIAGASVLELPW